MPEVRPNDTKLPRDWRNAYSAFQKLQSIGRALKEPVGSWQISYPSTREKLTGKGWRLRYTFNGQSYDVYLGSTGTASVATINEIIKGMQAILAGRRAEQKVRSSQPKPSTPKKVDVIFDPVTVSKLWAEYQVLLKKIRSTADLREFREKHKYLDWFMNRKAGILDMRMSEYLTNHPHARHGWITPPQTEEEYRKRQHAHEEIIRREESRKRFE